METLTKMQSYGENVDQGRLMREGGAYVDMFFPKMDRIQSAKLAEKP